MEKEFHLKIFRFQGEIDQFKYGERGDVDQTDSLERGFQDEEDNIDFIEFDDDTIIIPSDVFREHLPNSLSIFDSYYSKNGVIMRQLVGTLVRFSSSSRVEGYLAKKWSYDESTNS